jgi:hypothetical protein
VCLVLSLLLFYYYFFIFWLSGFELGFGLAKQALSHLSHTSKSILLWLFFGNPKNSELFAWAGLEL